MAEGVTASELDRIRDGDVRALARLISLVENESTQVRSAIRDLLPLTGGARVIGLTGAPGARREELRREELRWYA